jgi:phenylacetate-CoA ligase
VFETAVAQLRFAYALALGRPFHLASLEHLVQAARQTRHEFGSVGADGRELLARPTLDAESRREVQLRRFRTQATRAARETTYYKATFERLGLDPRRLANADIAHVPLTTKQALRDDPYAFVRTTARPLLQSMTTGTTGRPTSVHFSAYELRVMVSLSALGFLLGGHLDASDIVQISTSSRAVLGNLGLAGACAHLGAQVYVAGVIEPAQALRLLTTTHRSAGKKQRTSALSTYPSYLGQLIQTARELGYGPKDFGLERIFVGGELVTHGLRERARLVFGDNVELVENYAMTELLPMGGSLCSEQHLHFETAHGLLEVLDPDTGAPAAAGEPGTLVATPFPPFRETTLLLRYDTQDVVRPIVRPLGCSLRHSPTATSNLLGKLGLAVRHRDGWTFPRDVLEALEGAKDVPLPARCGFRAALDGSRVDVEVVAIGASTAARRRIAERLEAQGVPLGGLRVVTDAADLEHPFPLRCDLREASFA